MRLTSVAVGVLLSGSGGAIVGGFTSNSVNRHSVFSANKIKQGRPLSFSAVAVNGSESKTATDEEETSTPNNIRLSVFEKARTVTSVCTSGTLCTISGGEGIEGSPFGSYVDYILDDEGNPVFLMNDMSMHTINIRDNALSEGEGTPEGSRMVTLFTQLKSQGLDSRGQDVSRCSITGTISKIDTENDPPADIDTIKLRYSITHSYADRVMDSPKFSFYRLKPKKIYYVGGFGVQSSWVPPQDYRSATADILAREASDIITKLNRDHIEDILTISRQILQIPEIQDCKVTNVDRLGLDVRVTQRVTRTKLKTEEFRLGFRIPVLSVEDAKSEILKIFQEAWEKGEGLTWGDDEEPGSGIPVVKIADDSLW